MRNFLRSLGLIALLSLAVVGRADAAEDGASLMRALILAEKGSEDEKSISANDWFAVAEAISYITGVTDSVVLLQRSSEVASIPAQRTSMQMSKIVLRYLRGRPEKLTQHRGSLVLEALREAYPPKKK